MLIVFSGCLSTLYPFFTEKDLAYNPVIIGEWQYASKAEKGSILFQAIPKEKLSELAPGVRKIAAKGYLGTWKDSTGKLKSQYFVFLAKIGNYFYMDRYPTEMDSVNQVAAVFKQHYLKMHTCYRVDISNHNLFSMKRLERSFLDDLIKKNEIRMHYAETGDFNKTIITASTEELQAYLLKYGDNPKAYNTDYSYMCTRIIKYY